MSKVRAATITAVIPGRVRVGQIAAAIPGPLRVRVGQVVADVPPPPPAGMYHWDGSTWQYATLFVYTGEAVTEPPAPTGWRRVDVVQASP